MDDLKYKVTASGRTDAELLDVIDKREKYLPETIEASVAELQYRKYPLSDEFLKVVEEDVQAHRANATLSGRRNGFFNTNYNNSIVTDPDAPAFYSRLLIFAFAFFFSALFGAILLAININKTNNPARMIWVVLFGLVFTAFQISIGIAIGNSERFLSFLLSMMGAYILESLFWNRFIGNATFYRARPIWIPLIIGVVLYTLIFVIIFYGRSA